jgi:hypothetical protein
MPTVQLEKLQQKVIELLKESQPLSIPEIEHKLFGSKEFPVDTFDIRDAVGELVYEGKLRFLPGRSVQLAEV